MTIRFRWAVMACVLAIGLAVLLVMTQDRYQADQQRLASWQHLVPPSDSTWSVAQWKRMLHASSLPMPSVQIHGKQLTLTWPASQAGKVLPQLSSWLLRSSWQVTQLHISNHKTEQAIRIQLKP